VKLLNGAVFPNATVECLDFSNWFPFAMGSRPAPSSCAWQTRFLQNEKVHPSFDRAFGRADFLLIPRFPADPLTYQMMQSVYEKEIEATYERVAQSECWALLKKRWQKN